MAEVPGESDIDSPRNPLLRVHHEVHQDVVIVRAVGDIDLGTAPLLSDHLDQATAQLTPPAPLILDLSGVEFLASVGLSELLKHSQRCVDLGSSLVVVATHRAVLRTMQITGLTENITVVSSIDAALTIEAGA